MLPQILSFNIFSSQDKKKKKAKPEYVAMLEVFHPADVLNL